MLIISIILLLIYWNTYCYMTHGEKFILALLNVHVHPSASARSLRTHIDEPLLGHDP